MINFYNATKENIKEHNPNWPQIPEHPYIILLIAGSGWGKANSFFNLISQQSYIDKIHLYAKDPYEAKYQFLINKREITGLKYLMVLKLLLNTQLIWVMDYIYKIIEEYNPNKKQKILIFFDDEITDMLSNKNLKPVVTESLIRGKK